MELKACVREYLMPNDLPPLGGKIPIAGKPISSLVCDRAEFDKNIDDLIDVIGGEAVESCKTEGHLPFCTRGSKTQFLFDRYSLKTDFLCMIVRGKGEEIFRKVVGLRS